MKKRKNHYARWALASLEIGVVRASCTHPAQKAPLRGPVAEVLAEERRLKAEPCPKCRRKAAR